MKNEFIPYTQALSLKELGFDEPCFSVYYNGEYHEHGIQNQFLHEKNECSAPLYQQAFRWFREKYGLISYIHPLALLQDTKKWCYEITNFESSWDEDSDLHTLEEAELACLVKLIEMTKTK